MIGERGVIFTDGNGKPFERPEPPPAGATTEQRIAYLDALFAYREAIRDCGNKAFDEAFRRALQAK